MYKNLCHTKLYKVCSLNSIGRVKNACVCVQVALQSENCQPLYKDHHREIIIGPQWIKHKTRLN